MPDISDIVRTDTQTRPGGSAFRAQGQGLLITLSGLLAAGGPGKIRQFTNLDAVGRVFPQNTEAYKSAAAWFAQSPFPKALNIARWADGDVSTEMIGGAPSGPDAAPLNANNASFTIDGEDIQVDLSGEDTHSKIAPVLQNAIRGLAAGAGSKFAGALVTYANNVYTITLDGDSVINPPYLVPRVDGNGDQVGTDISGALGLGQDGATYHQGSDAETISEFIDNAAFHSEDDFYYLATDADVPAEVNGVNTQIALAAKAQASRRFAVVLVSGAASLVPNESASIAAQLAATESSHFLSIHTKSSLQKHIGAAALLSGQNLDGPDSVITLKFKTLAGETADDYTDAEIAELQRKRVNFYTRYGNIAMLAEGTTGNPTVWADVRVWLDWLVSRLETDVMNLLTSSRRVPLTPAGVARLMNVVNGVLEQGVENGGIASGVVSPAMQSEIRRVTGNEAFDGNLTNGYLAYIQPLSTLSQSQRDARTTPPMYIWLKGSSAIHALNISLIFEN